MEKFLRIHYVGNSRRDSEEMTELKCEPDTSKEIIIFMSMYKRGNKENCIANAHRVTEYARKFIRGHWSFPRPGSEKRKYGTHVCKPDGQRDEVAENMNESILQKVDILYSVHPALLNEEN